MAGRGFGGALMHLHGQALVLVREAIATDSRQSPGPSPCPRLFVQAIESEHLPLSLIGLWLDRLWEPNRAGPLPVGGYPQRCGLQGCRAAGLQGGVGWIAFHRSTERSQSGCKKRLPPYA